MAGNAIGLGNFLRFPRQAALNGGGAFMIPYFTALLLLGLPMVWIEWAIGRHGGAFGHGSAPGIFARLWKHPAAKYLGAFGLAVALCFVIYYTYIEAWTLGFAGFSAVKYYWGINGSAEMSRFLGEFQGKVDISAGHQYFSGIWIALLFYLGTLGLNVWILYRGVQAGIEKFAKFAMPLLFLFAIILLGVVVSIGVPDPAHPENSVMAGFAYIWNPDFSLLASPAVWLAAAGQIFFTLSLGSGNTLVYASYVKRDQDIALSGLATASTNEFAEVVLGGSIAIPIAVATFGLTATQNIAKAGSFDLGFTSMPLIFQRMGDLGPLYGVLWFGLLFFAGITSSVALAQPMIAFMQDEFKWERKKSVTLTAAIMLLGGLPCVLFLQYGFLDEMDFWAGTFGIVAVALIEVILFAWIFGMEKGWSEIMRGADIHVPNIYRFIIKYVTPVYLSILLIAWAVMDAWPILIFAKSTSGQAVPPGDIPYLMAARLMMLGIVAFLAIMVRVAWKKNPREGLL